MAQTIIWTTLPRGLRHKAGDGWQAGLSLFVSPRLEVAGSSVPLGGFKDFSDWPRVAKNTRFRLCLGGDGEPAGDGIEIEPVSGGGESEPDSAAWQAIFAADAPVRPYDTGGDAARASVLAYDAVEVSRAVRGYYARNLKEGANGKWSAGTQAASAPFLANQAPPTSDRITVAGTTASHGDRAMTAYRMSGSCVSIPYFAFPVTMSIASMAFCGLPTMR